MVWLNRSPILVMTAFTEYTIPAGRHTQVVGRDVDYVDSSGTMWRFHQLACPLPETKRLL
jgi:hypothetical protein